MLNPIFENEDENAVEGSTETVAPLDEAETPKNDPDTQSGDIVPAEYSGSSAHCIARETGVKEDDLDMDWLQRALKSKKDYFRRYRDICIFSMIGVYLLNVLDAYVDASLSHFDISPDLTVDVKPAVISNYSGGGSYTPSRLPGLGLQCAISF